MNAKKFKYNSSNCALHTRHTFDTMLRDGLGHFFLTFVRLMEGRGSLKLFVQSPIRTNTFQKGASITLLCLTSIDPTSGGELKCFCTITEI